MPCGRWRGGAEGPCPRRIHRFVEPCLLLLLHRDNTHGYDLADELHEFGFGERFVDSSVVYRTLRDMETQGLVTSSWEMVGSGAPRRIYAITAEGDVHLARWVDDLRETDRVLQRFLMAYTEHMQEGEGEHHDANSSSDG